MTKGAVGRRPSPSVEQGVRESDEVIEPQRLEVDLCPKMREFLRDEVFEHVIAGHNRNRRVLMSFGPAVDTETPARL